MDVESTGGALERRRARRRDVRRVRGCVRTLDRVRGRGPERDATVGNWDRSHRLGAEGRVLLARRSGVDPRDDRVRLLQLAQRQIFRAHVARAKRRRGRRSRWSVFNSREAARGAYDFDATCFSLSRVETHSRRRGDVRSPRRGVLTRIFGYARYKPTLG